MVTGFARFSWLYSNLGAKLAAVALALAVYFYAYSSEEVEQTIAFPLELVGVPDSLVPQGAPPKEVKVKVRGLGRELLGLRFGDVKVNVDLSGVSSGRYFRAFTASDVVLPPGSDVTVLEVVSPRTMNLKFERTASKKVAVEPRIVGRPEPGWELVVPIKVSPESVLIAGPLSAVEKVKSLAVDRLDISGAADTLVRPVHVNSNNLGVTVKPDTVRLTVPIEPRIRKELAGIPVTVLRSRAVKRVSVFPESALVVVSGPKSQVESLTPSDIIVKIDASRMDAGEFLIAPTVSASKRLRIESISPDRFQVILEPF